MSFIGEEINGHGGAIYRIYERWFGFSDGKVIFAVHFLNPKTADKHANTVRNRIYSHSGVVRGRY